MSCLHGGGSITAMAACSCGYGGLCIALALALLPQRQPRHAWQHVHMSILGQLLAADAYGGGSLQHTITTCCALPVSFCIGIWQASNMLGSVMVMHCVCIFHWRCTSAACCVHVKEADCAPAYHQFCH